MIIEGPASSRVASYAAPPLDAWDRWNYARTDHFLDAVSARYVSPDAYGVSDLDRYGAWRVVPTYGAVWVPTAVQRELRGIGNVEDEQIIAGGRGARAVVGPANEREVIVTTG